LLTLAEARDKAIDHRRAVANGLDPVEAKRDHRRTGVTFAEMANAYIAIKKEGWRSESHFHSMRLLLQTYGSPLATKHVNSISSDDIEFTVRGLRQWKRTLEAIRQVFNLAISKSYCTSNPADWQIMKYRFHSARQQGAHYTAMPYAEVPELVQRLRARQQPGRSLSPYVIEFLILTACRVNEVTQMQ
jgi:integrase